MRSREGRRQGSKEQQQTKRAFVVEAPRSGSGRPLEPSAQESFSNLFGHDFSHVRIHSGIDADRSTRALGTNAYTVGRDIVFRDGHYAPSTERGRHVLGHELAHVVQQSARAAAVHPGAEVTPLLAPSLEAQAESASRAAARGQRVDLSSIGHVDAVAAGAQNVQCFGSLEHKELGDAGSGNESYALPGGGTVAARLTHGDLTMLGGDYFDPRDGAADSLFALISRPSRNPGAEVGTQDEILYALYKINAADPRFAPGGVWAALTFSDEVKNAVDARYLRLAADNKEHFASPNGSLGGARSGNRSSAGGSYRALHEDAIVRAFAAGRSGAPIDAAMMREAAAQHFMTDHFAAGHLRTPRASIRTFWRAKYPRFWEQLKHTIAQRIAEGIDADPRTTGPASYATVGMLRSNIEPIVEEKTRSKPALGFDDLVSKIAHDVDNQTGLRVINDLGQKWKAFGDENLHNPDPDNLTADMAQNAVWLGNKDIQNAYSIGRSSTSNTSQPTNERVGEMVRAQTSPPARRGVSNYGPEQLLPRIDSSETSVQTWRADSIDALWNTQVRSDGQATYGDRIRAEVSNGEIHHQLSSIAIPQPYRISHFNVPVLGTRPLPYTPGRVPGIVNAPVESVVYPGDAYNSRFLNPLIADPLASLKAILSST